MKDTSDLLATGVQPGNEVKSRLDVIVFILVFNKTGHRQFTCCRCPDLNLGQLSESESEASSAHVLHIINLHWQSYGTRIKI